MPEINHFKDFVMPEINHNTIITYGKYRNKKLGDIPILELDSYLGYLEDMPYKSHNSQQNIAIINAYLRLEYVELELERAMEEKGDN